MRNKVEKMLEDVKQQLEKNEMDRLIFEAENKKERQTLQLMNKMLRNSIALYDIEVREGKKGIKQNEELLKALDREHDF